MTHINLKLENYNENSVKLSAPNKFLKDYHHILSEICGMIYNGKLRDGEGYIASNKKIDTIQIIARAIMNGEINASMTSNEVRNLLFPQEKKITTSNLLATNNSNKQRLHQSNCLSELENDVSSQTVDEMLTQITNLIHKIKLKLNATSSENEKNAISETIQTLNSTTPTPNSTTPTPLTPTPITTSTLIIAPLIPIIGSLLTFYMYGIKNASKAKILSVDSDNVTLTATFDDKNLIKMHRISDNEWKIIGYDLPHYLCYE